MAQPRRLHATCCMLLLSAAVIISLVEGVSHGGDDDLLDDLSVEQLRDQGTDGYVFHADVDHMSKDDIHTASDVFDTLYGTDSDSGDELGESAESQAHEEALKSLQAAKKAERKATKKLLKAKSVEGTKAAKKELKKAK